MELTGPTAVVPLLTRRQAFSCQLPSGVVPRPARMAGSLIYAGAPRLVTFAYANSATPFQVAAQYNPQQFRSPQGFDGVIYSVPQSPAMAVALWRLRDGQLWTFMPDHDLSFPNEPAPGREGLEQIIRSITVDYLRGYPSLTAADPVSTGSASDIQQQASTYFQPAREGDWPTVRFSEDDRLGAQVPQVGDVNPPPGAGEPGQWGEFSVLTAHGLRVTCLGPLDQNEDIMALTAAIAQSVTPMN
jgi:hypothetical protein